MTQVPRYEDFALGFHADPNNPRHFRVTIQQAPCPGRGGSFRLPFPAEEMDALLAGLEGQITGRGARRNLRQPSREAPVHTPEELGDALFRALFHGEVRDSFLQSQSEALFRLDTGLRLRLVIDPETPEGALLASLPWELLYRHETRDHLSRNLKTPVVRFLVTPAMQHPATLEDDLRILLVSADSRRSAALDLASEASELKQTWTSRGLEVHHLENPSMRERDLHRAIRDMDPHVLHFMGHAAFDDRTGEGGLVLGDGYGRPQLYTAELLQQDARADSSLRLVCLNACDTGRLPRRKGQDPFSGLASSLVMAGVPAVVAMQFPISDEAALAFSTGLYQALAAGDPVDAAVTEGRMAVFTQNQRSWEWATPALYLSVPDGRLFTDGKKEEAQPSTDKDSHQPTVGSKTFVSRNNRFSIQGDSVSIGTTNVYDSDRSDSREER